MTVEFEVVNANNELALSLEKPAMTLDPWATAKVNDPANRTLYGTLGSGLAMYFCDGDDVALGDPSTLIGFRTNSSRYAAVVLRTGSKRIDVWASSDDIWNNGFELAVFRRSDKITNIDTAVFDPGEPDCELRTADGTRTIYNSAWPNVIDAAPFDSYGLIHGSVTAAFDGRSRAGGVDWIMISGVVYTYARFSEKLNAFLYKKWDIVRESCLTRIAASSNGDVTISRRREEHSRASGSSTGVPAPWPDIKSQLPLPNIHVPNFMVFRTFGSYK